MEPKDNALAPVKDFFEKENVKQKFVEILGTRGNAYCASILALINGNPKLKACTPESLYMGAVMAATLNLPVNENFGFAYFVPYGGVCQFQIGYKGIIQLAQRSGQYKTISGCPIYKEQLIKENPLEGFVFDFTKKPGKDEKPIGYASYFELTNGFKKTAYMSVEEVKEHGKRFSKAFKSGPWQTDFDAMAIKTVMKLSIMKYGPLSTDTLMQKAVTADQAVIKNADTMDVEYVDMGKSKITPEELQALFNIKFEALTKEEREDCVRVIKGQEELSYEKIKKMLESK